jgi:hypothetical protein
MRLAVAGICLMVMPGCFERTVRDGTLTFSYAVWVPTLVVIAGLAAVAWGVVLMTVRKKRLNGAFVIVAGVAAAGGIAPMMYLDRTVVSQDGFYSRHGFWWSPTVHDIRYDDLKLVQVGVEEKMGRQGKTYSYFFDCTSKSGKQERVPLGDIMRQALPEIAQQFRDHGVTVVIPPNLPQ